MANQASMVRRQRERERQQKRREKQKLKAQRREEKKARLEASEPIPDDPMKDPTIDWDSAVQETEVILDENLEVVEEFETEAEAGEQAKA